MGQNRCMSTRKQPVISSEIDSVLGPAPASLARPEIVVLRFRKHGGRLTLPVLVLVAVALAAGFWVGALPELWMNLVAAIGAVSAAALFGVAPILSWLATRTTVTTSRVIMRRGLLSRQRSEVPLARVREVRTRQGILQRLVRTGTIDLVHGVDAYELRDVPGVMVVADAVQELVQRNYAAEGATPFFQ